MLGVFGLCVGEDGEGFKDGGGVRDKCLRVFPPPRKAGLRLSLSFRGFGNV